MSLSRRALQVTVAVLAIVPVTAGAGGVIMGADAISPGPSGSPPWPVDLDSHIRFLSGVFLAIGLVFWSCIPGIERKGPRFRLAAGAVVLGGIARLLSLVVAGTPGPGHLLGLGLELLVVPALVLWQARVSRAVTSR